MSHYWIQLQPQSIWNSWIPNSEWSGKETTQEDDNFWKELMSRKILIQGTLDKLTWGYQPKGYLTVKEAYKLLNPVQDNQIDKIWDKIWNPNLWPKVKTFIWLMSRGMILIWDQLSMLGFHGPSTFPLCHLEK